MERNSSFGLAETLGRASAAKAYHITRLAAMEGVREGLRTVWQGGREGGGGGGRNRKAGQ